MSCTSPLRGYQTQVGSPLVFSVAGYRPGSRHLEVPCGRCVECRLSRSREWAVRCVHEAQMHERSVFITLTYDDVHLPPALSLVYRDYQLFMKRLLKRFPGSRFFMCGEYGELRSRPHYHACLFGVGFEDGVPWKKSESGEMLYRSALLDGLWSMGHASYGSVTMQSAGYVARYVLKKELGSSAGCRRDIFDPETGEILSRPHEFSQMSLRPGIGRSWIEKFWRDVYPHGYVVVDGSKMPAPRYYDKWFAVRDPVAAASMVAARVERAELRFDEGDPHRLRAKALVASARVSFLKRSIE